MRGIRQLKVSVLGAGMMGTALSVHIANKGFIVNIWVRRKELCKKMLELRENPEYYPGIKLPKKIHPINDISQSVNNVDVIFLAVPSHAVPEVAERVSMAVSKNATIVNVAKGMSYPPPKMLSEVLFELGFKKVLTMSGPNFAHELIRKVPSVTVLASKDTESLLIVKRVIESDSLFVTTTQDVAGVQIGGIMKGLVAISIGIADALEMGDNVRGLLFAEGIHEMIEMCQYLGGRAETILGPAGLGDLAATAFSLKSRNRAIGYMMGFGLSSQTINNVVKDVVVEGARSLLAIREIAQKKGCALPLIDALYEIFYENKQAKNALYNLCARKLRAPN